ncbi:MAG: prohibitin family protein [Flavobacteriales bacterium]|nr:prohibitin family protein [Flavobacteriales bacterium]
MKTNVIVILMGALLSSCAIIRPGEVGVKRTLGKLNKKVLKQGAYGYNPFVTTIIKTPTRTVNIEVKLDLPSKEGLNIQSIISILYKIEEQKVPVLLEDIGENYERIITSVFRSASADVCAQFLAKDMYSGKRGEIEAAIAKKMNEILAQQGIVIENVLMKNIQLPPGLARAIEVRLEAEQDALRMKFVLEQEKLEAERKRIEAGGTRDAQKILSEGLTKEIIQLRSIEAFQRLSDSPSSKVIITDGASPFLIEDN